MAPLDKANPYIEKIPTNQADLQKYYWDQEWILKRNLEKFDKTYFGGDALPCLFPYWGTGGHAKYICDSASVEYQPDTIWIHPSLGDEYDPEYFIMKEDNAFFQRELTLLRELSKEGMEKFFVTPPDNCGSYDALSQLRGNADLMMDMLDDSAPVKAAGKGLVLQLKKQELAVVLENLSPEGLMIIVMDAESKEEADEILKYTEKHSVTKKLF